MLEQTVLETEVAGLIALSGLTLVFVPFFLDRLRDKREGSTAGWLALSRVMTYLTALLVVLPCLSAGLGLLTLWGAIAAAPVVGVMTLAAITGVGLYTILIILLENTVWWS